MVQTRASIEYEMSIGKIAVMPFDSKFFTPQGYDLHLGKNILIADGYELDPKEDISGHYRHRVLDESGFLLTPGMLVLGVSIEYTESHGFLPEMHGTSTNGRMGFETHICAGCGDDGFCGHWTLELRATVPVRIYPGMPIGQLIWSRLEGDSEADDKYGAKGVNYNNGYSDNPMPVVPNLHAKPHKFLHV